MLNILNRNKNVALEHARKQLKAARLGQLHAQEDMDRAESLHIYHKLREDSLVEFIVRLEKLEEPKPVLVAKPEVENDTSIPAATEINAFVEKGLPAFNRRRRAANPPIPTNPTPIEQV